mgnify:CR=1 FL=1
MALALRRYWNLEQRGVLPEPHRIHFVAARGPFTLASHVVGGTEFLAAVDDEPDSTRFVLDILDTMTETTIRFSVPEAGHVDLRIYDVAGRLVRTLVDGKLAADSYEVTWNGTNNGGRKVSSGVYFYRIKAGRHEKTKKMVLLR